MHHAQHVGSNKKSIANCRQAKHRQQQAQEHTQSQSRVETLTKQLSANEHLKEGKDRGGKCITQDRRSSRTPTQ